MINYDTYIVESGSGLLTVRLRVMVRIRVRVSLELILDRYMYLKLNKINKCTVTNLPMLIK